ncbi:hypothetical protein BH11GEM1_BH11GEM1_00520 [soil metagenome]
MRRVRAAVLVLLASLALPRVGLAQGEIRIELPPDTPFPAAPQFYVRAINFDPSTAPRRVRVRMALDQSFGLVVYDSTIAGDEPRFGTVKLLPENRDIFVEASVIDRNGIAIGTARTLGGHTGPRLRIIAPVGKSGVTFRTRRPSFHWSSAAVSLPPGPWVYELSLTEVATPLVSRSQLGIMDSVYTYTEDLDANTSYRWKVIARLPNGLPTDSAVAVGPSTFTIEPSDAVVKTLLYQNFPNPFPAASSSSTCVWFDLRTAAHVDLTILDLRGHLVKTMIPGGLSSQLAAGRYGRLHDLTSSGCDPAFAWDGTTDAGRNVPAGVYLVRFRVEGEAESVKKILFLGR